MLGLWRLLCCISEIFLLWSLNLLFWVWLPGVCILINMALFVWDLMESPPSTCNQELGSCLKASKAPSNLLIVIFCLHFVSICLFLWVSQVLYLLGVALSDCDLPACHIQDFLLHISHFIQPPLGGVIMPESTEFPCCGMGPCASSDISMCYLSMYWVCRGETSFILGAGKQWLTARLCHCTASSKGL